jgi:hypothetical protein
LEKEVESLRRQHNEAPDIVVTDLSCFFSFLPADSHFNLLAAVEVIIGLSWDKATKRASGTTYRSERQKHKLTQDELAELRKQLQGNHLLARVSCVV